MRTCGPLVRRAAARVRRALHLDARVAPARAMLALLAVLAGLAGLGPGAAPASAQTSTASLRGYVRGEGGAPVGQAQVSARNLENNITRNATTNDAGFYYMGGLRPGRYEVNVRRIGMAPQTRVVVLPVGLTVDADFSTASAAVQLAQVQVRAEAGATTRTSEVGTNISREQIENLPNVERNFLDIARLAPGVTARTVNDQDKVLAAGGQPAEAVNVFVDGATYKNDVLKGGVVGQDASKGNPFPQGAVQEFRIITQNYKAEYQKAASAIITATTRTGGNRWEGELFTQGIAKAYVARDPIAIREARGRPNYERLQAGFNLGGPIARDRLFFFGTYELNARDQPEYVRYRSQGVADTANAAIRALLDPYLGEYTSEFRQHLGFGKLTWAQSDRSTFDLSTTIRRETDFRGFGGGTAFEANENVRIGVYNGVGNWRYATNAWLNEAQVNFQHFVWSPEPGNPNLVARDYENLLRIGGKDGRQTFTQDRLSFRNDVTRSGVLAFGTHVFKGGASLDFLGYDAAKANFETPVFNYRGGTGWQQPTDVTFGYGDPDVDARNTQFGAYLQDDWTVTRKLLLNLGLRWDVETNMANNSYVTPGPMADSLRAIYAGNQAAFNVGQPVDTNPDGSCCVVVQRRPIDELGGLENFITSGRSDRPAFLGAWQPRLGASYDFFGDGRTVLFGGIGIYYDRTYWNTLLDEPFRRQWRQTNVRFNPPGGTCDGCIDFEERFFDPAQLRTITGPAANPEVFLVANDLKPPRSTQSSVGIRQAVGRLNVTLSYNGIRGENYMNFIRGSQWGGPGPNYNTVFLTDDRGRRWYDALQLQVERPIRVDTRWGGAIAYTLSRADQQGKPPSDIFWGFDDRFTTVADLPRERAPGDQRHAVVANAVVRLPLDFRLSGIVNLGSGVSTTATNERVGTGIYRGTYVYSPPTRAFLGVGNVFNNQNLDLRVDKGFAIGGTQRVSLVADLFNALNSRNYGCYDAFIPATGTNTSYNRPGCAAPGRRFQLGLRYGFTGTGDGTAPSRAGDR